MREPTAPPQRATSTPPPPRRSGSIPVQPAPAAPAPPRDVDSAIRRIEADSSRPIVDTPRSGSSFAGDTSPGAPPLRNDDSGLRAEELPYFFDDDLAEPPTAQLTTAALDPQARAVIATCESELETKPDAVRAARLQYEIARAYELAIGFSEQAAEHYRLALDSSPEYLPAIQGSRRTEIARGNFDAALALFDAEDKLTSSPKRKALLLYEKGRLVEDQQNDPVRARELYTRAFELDPHNASVLKAIEQCDRRAENSGALIETFERAANAVTQDPHHRAALHVQRAQLIERAPSTPGPSAPELYESALALDEHTTGALDALVRIHRTRGQWRELAATLEREAGYAQDAARRALLLHKVAAIQDERLGNRPEAIEALVNASEARPEDPLVLEDLARGYEHAERYHELADVLSSLIDLTGDKRERAALLYRLGQVLDGSLADPERAIARYQAALAIEPTSVPVLQALGRLLQSRNQWAALIDMHSIEANATDVPLRAAAAHARIAEIFETHLRDATEAVNHHARALTLSPGYATSFKALMRLYAQLDRHRDLVELLERAIAEATAPALRIAYLMKLGSIWEDSLADPVQALHAYRRVLDHDANHLVAIHAMQRVAEQAERHAVLVEAIEREAELVDDTALKVALLHRAGAVLDEQLSDQDAALVRFRKALDLDPGFVPALTSVGRIYHRGGRWSELLEIYERQARATTGEEAVALLHKMGELSEDKLGDTKAAIGWYRRALELDKGYRPSIRALVRMHRDAQEWTDLAKALELEVASLEHAPARAVTWYRIGQVYEDWLDNADKAIAAYRSALGERADYRPARVALGRLYEARGEWMQLIDVLSQEAEATTDKVRAVAMLMRQGEVYRDHLADPDLAVHCFEAALQHDFAAVPALLALEPLYAKAGGHTKLAGVYAEMGKRLADPGARIAALRELARLQREHKIGTYNDRARTYESILSIDPQDPWALAQLEEIGRGTRNDALLVEVYRRLADTADQPALAATYLTDLAQALERRDDRRALDAYKDAVKRDPGLLTAIRGLARVGDLLGNPRAMAQAARLEAELTRKPEMAAKLFVRSGILRREQMNDLGAVEDFERALEVWPDDTQAAERIIAPLLETGQVLHLVDVLTKAAISSKSPERRTALWLEVGGLYVRRLDNLGAGITAFKRALEATPGHVSVLAKLAEAYQKNQQWGDAVASLEQLLALTSDDKMRGEAQLELAAIFDERLNKPDRATKCVESVLRHNPKHAAALRRLADIQLRSGNEADAVTTTQRLVDLAATPKEKGAALVRVARIQRKRGEAAAADTALSEALGLEGPGGDAEADLKQSIAKHGSWVGYAAGLSVYIKRASVDKEAGLVTAYLELAKTYAEHMGLPARAIDALTEGIDHTDGDQRITMLLAKLLRGAGRLDESLQHLKHALAVDPTNVDAWRELSILFEQGGRRDDAIRSHAAIAVLNVERHTKAAARPASAHDNSFAGGVLATLAADNACMTPAANMLAAIADGIGKIFPPSLERYGLTTRDRLGPKSHGSIWELAVRVAKIYGAEQLEVYEHTGAEPAVVVEPFEVPALIVAQHVRRLPLAQQAFLMAYAIGGIASRLHPAIWLHTSHLEVALTGGARVMHPTFSIGRHTDEEVNNARDVLRKVVVRKWRRPMELAGDELAGKAPPDIAAWQATVKQTMLRAAMIVADDLGATLDAMRFLVDLPPVRGAALAQGSEAVRDLMRFWVSNRAASVRQMAGMLIV